MFRFAALLALVAVSSCSAFNLEVSESVQAHIASLGEAGVGKDFWFPCDGVTAKEMESLDLNRYQGHWFATNVAFSSTHKVDSNSIQKKISETLSCGSFNGFNNTNPNAPTLQQLVGLRNAVNGTVPGWTVLNGTELYRSLNVSTPRQGDNGKWAFKVPVGNGTNVWIDVLIVATDYTKTSMWYTCQDVPVPGTVDTVREQQWGLWRRKPKNFNGLELAALKLIALSRGIMDADRLYTLPVDGCWNL